MLINNLEAITVTRFTDKMWRCGAVYNGAWKYRYYAGCTRAQAVKKFKTALKKGEV